MDPRPPFERVKLWLVATRLYIPHFLEYRDIFAMEIVALASPKSPKIDIKG